MKTEPVLKWTMLLLCLLPAFSAAAERISVDPNVRYQVFDGFGEGTMDQFTSYYYDAYPSSSLSSYLNQLYMLNDKGLGLTICRVPMPVGDAPGHEHHGKFSWSANRPPESFEPQDGVYDWTRYGKYLWKVQGASSRGARMWAFWYSMPYWMTVSGCTAGNGDGTTNNLKAGMEGRFAEHMCRVLKHFRDTWDIRFEYVSAINEPEADWWDYWGSQPGCYVDSPQAIEIHEALKSQLIADDLPVKMIAYDSAYTNTVSYLNQLLNSPIGPALDVLACHQYSTSTWGLEEWGYLGSRSQKPIWMTEWGDWTNAQYPGYNGDAHQQMLNYAWKIYEALEVLKAGGWIMWEPEFIFNSQTLTFIPRKAYWAVAQYSRHIRPGMRRIKSTGSTGGLKTTVWISEAPGNEENIVLVTANFSQSALTGQYDLSAFPGVEVLKVFRTSSLENYVAVDFAQSASDSLTLTMPAESITTVVGKVTRCGLLYGDMNRDCIVDLLDIEQLADVWLTGGASGEKPVDFEEVGVVSREWGNFCAFAPQPEDGQAGVHPAAGLLQWGAHDLAVAHRVYLGNSYALVAAADTTSPFYLGQADVNVFKPHLLPSQTYYWRVDEVNADGGVCKGPVWSFTTDAQSPDPDLLGHWKMDESSGTSAGDSSSALKHGTLKGNPVWRPASGKIGGAIELDGSGDAVEIPNWSFTGDTLTMTAWVYATESVPWAGIVYSRNNAACGMHFEFTNRLRYTWNNDDPATWGWDAGLTIPLNEWVLTALVIQPDSARLYVFSDSTGLQEARRDLYNKIQILDHLKIGWDSLSNDRFFTGLIDDVRIYKRALCRQEILALIP